MNQNERRTYLIKQLLQEASYNQNMKIPEGVEEQRRLLRSLMNIRMPGEISEEFLREQDTYLRNLKEEKGVVTIEDLEEREPDLYLWKGDITRLQAGAIVNAANSGMTGCYQPCHNCIDNAIPFQITHRFTS